MCNFLSSSDPRPPVPLGAGEVVAGGVDILLKGLLVSLCLLRLHLVGLLFGESNFLLSICTVSPGLGVPLKSILLEPSLMDPASVLAFCISFFFLTMRLIQ